jgi:hydrogenase maturation protease
MSRVASRILIAGIGNVFFGDDGFGPEVVRRLSTEALPEGVELYDVGIRGMHLAYKLLDGWDLLVAVDTVARGGTPGTGYLIEADTTATSRQPDAHSVDLPWVFAIVRALGGPLGRVLVVGCEPEALCERIGLSAPVAAAVEPAMKRIRQIAEEGRAT